MNFRFERFNHARHRALVEARRRSGVRMWAAVVACVVVPVVLVALVKGFL